MTKNQTHEWHERAEDGAKRYLRGHWNSREWAISVLNPDAERWERLEKPSMEVWTALRDVLWRKYQRKRIPYKLVERVDLILANGGVQSDSTKSD